jgi:hypothetical protein
VYDTTAILATHGSEKNPRLCAGCHVNSLTGVDAGGNQVSYSGHSFHPLPCFMAGSPGVVDTTFDNSCAYDQPSRSWAACAASGCHSEPVAVQLLNSFRDEKEGYLDVIWVDLNSNQKLDAYPADTGYLAKVQLNAPTELIFDTLIDPQGRAVQRSDARRAPVRASRRIAWRAQSVPVPGTSIVNNCGSGSQLRRIPARAASVGAAGNPACDPKRAAPDGTGN